MTGLISRWLIRRRDNAASRWIDEHQPGPKHRAWLRLNVWGALLGAWTHDGTRRLSR